MEIKDDEVHDFCACLYKGQCHVCASGLDWEASFDADGTNYYAECCGLRYVMRPHSVTTHVAQREE